MKYETEKTYCKYFDLQISKKDYVKNTCYFEGYASIFNNVDSYGEMILYDSVDCYNSNNDNKNNNNEIIILWQHLTEYPIGKTIHISKDENGVFIKGKILTDIKKGFETYRLMKEGVVNGLSIGFIPINSYYDKNNIKVLSKIKICEISVVCFPANAEALITDIKNNTSTETENLIAKINYAINVLSNSE